MSMSSSLIAITISSSIRCLIEAGCGSIEPRHCTVPIREFAPKAELLMAEVSGLDIEQQRVHFQLVGDDHCRSIEYDHLVVALGSVTRVMPENVVFGCSRACILCETHV